MLFICTPLTGDRNMNHEFMWCILITMNSIQAAVLPSNRITFLRWNSPVAATYEVSHEEFPTKLSSWTQFQCGRRVAPQKTNISQDTSRVSENSTQFLCYLPEDSIRFHRLRVQSNKTTPPNTHTLQTPAASPGSQCFWPTSYRLDVPTTALQFRMPITSPGFHLYSWPTGYKSEILTPLPCIRLIS